MSMANAFSGGVFLSLAFGHLLPHAIAELSALAAGGASLGVAPEVAACMGTLAGYLLVFAAEKVAVDPETLLDERGRAGRERGAVLLLSALAVHSLVESAALGVQSSRKSALLLAASIGEGRTSPSSRMSLPNSSLPPGMHQPAESVALLVALVKAGLPRRGVAALLAAFSLVGPLGLGAGILAKQVGGGALEPLLVALTAGTFLYVGATEVVAEEFGEAHGTCDGTLGASKAAKVLSMLVGMAITGAAIVVAERFEAAALAL